MDFMEQDLEEPRREELYLAQLTAEVVRGQVKQPRLVRGKDFILNFRQSEMDTGADTTASKQFWFALVGCPQPPPKEKEQ